MTHDTTETASATGDVMVRITKWRFWYFLLGWPAWRKRTWTATDSGIIARHGILSRNEKKIAWARITDKTIQQSVIGRIFNHGTITLESAGESSGSMVMANIGDAERMYDVIVARCDAANDHSI